MASGTPLRTGPPATVAEARVQLERLGCNNLPDDEIERLLEPLWHMEEVRTGQHGASSEVRDG